MITIIRCKNHTLHINNTVYAFSDKGHLYTVILTSDICSYRCINLRWHAKVINILIIIKLAKPLLYKYAIQDPTLCKGSSQSNLSFKKPIKITAVKILADSIDMFLYHQWFLIPKVPCVVAKAWWSTNVYSKFVLLFAWFTIELQIGWIFYTILTGKS